MNHSIMEFYIDGLKALLLVGLVIVLASLTDWLWRHRND